MEKDDLQIRKLRLIERFTRIEDSELLAKVEALLLSSEQEELSRNVEPITKEQATELQSRYKQHKEDPSSARPWKEVKAELMAKYGYNG